MAQLGFIGLGNMGMNMVRRLHSQQIDVVAWNRSPEARDIAAKEGITVAQTVQELISKTAERKIIFLMVSAGSAIDSILFEGSEALLNLLQPGDIIIDGANSFYKDSKKRAAILIEKGIFYLDAGISGGVDGALHGASVMVGGNEGAFQAVEFIFKALAQPDGYGYFGESGSGHYVKMIHNSIEYGMLEVIAEGMNLLAYSDVKVDFNKLLSVWQNGSIIQSRLIGFLKEALTENKNTDILESEIGALGTGMWSVSEALEKGIPYTAIAHSVFQRYQSRGMGDFAFKLIQAMRAKFGAHTSKEREPQK